MQCDWSAGRTPSCAAMEALCPLLLICGLLVRFIQVCVSFSCLRTAILNPRDTEPVAFSLAQTGDYVAGFRKPPLFSGSIDSIVTSSAPDVDRISHIRRPPHVVLGVPSPPLLPKLLLPVPILLKDLHECVQA